MVLAAAYLAWGAGRLLVLRPRSAARRYGGTSVAGRTLWLVGLFLLSLVPLAAFAAAGYLTLAALDPLREVRLLALAWINASLVVRVAMAVSRVLSAPDTPRLRLLPADDAGAALVDTWLRRVLATAVYGWFALQAALLLGLRPVVYGVLSDLLGLLVVALVAAGLLGHREAISRAIRGADAAEGEGPATMRMVRQRLAASWLPLALGYLAVVLAMWVLEVPGGFLHILRATALSVVVLVLANAAGHALARMLPRWLGPPPRPAAGPVTLRQRLRRYGPLAQGAARWAVYLAAAIALLQVWGIDALGWLAGDMGGPLVGTLAQIAGILVVTVALWELSASFVEGWLAETDSAGRPRTRSARTRTLLTVARNALLVVLTLVATLMILAELGVNIGPLLAGAGVLGLAIGFGAQRLVQDIITGVFILLQDLMSVGDVVKLGDRAGLVEAISIRTVRLRDLSGTVHTIPFSAIDTVSNLTKDFSFHVFDIGVAYRENVDEVMEILQQVGAELREDPEVGPLILEDLEVFGVDAFGDSAVVIKGRIKTQPIKQWQVGRAFNRLVKLRFDAAGVEIPFPHRTLYFGEDKSGGAPPLRLDAGESQDLVRQLRPDAAAPDGA
jgi:small conductance mechanosensitive channel